jgi:hypothetical protein
MEEALSLSSPRKKRVVEDEEAEAVPARGQKPLGKLHPEAPGEEGDEGEARL